MFINDHFKPDSNAALPGGIVFQSLIKSKKTVSHPLTAYRCSSKKLLV